MTRLVKAALTALHYTRAGSLVAPYTAGDGVIFMLHQVTPQPPNGFDPNGILRVTPDFLGSVIREVRAKGYDIVSMDDVAERLHHRRAKPFAAFTLDDGYRDNRDFALPVFKAADAPFTIYVPTNFPDHEGELWWLALEEALRRLLFTTVTIGRERRSYWLETDAEKSAAFDAIYWRLRAIDEEEARAVVRRLAVEAGFDVLELTRDLIMTWKELRELAADPLVTIGAHTRTHFALAKLSDAAARDEIAVSVRRIEIELQRPCRHFSYPYGCEASAGDREFAIARDLGLVTAVTTRKGLLHESHRNALTALPRLSLNGDYQDSRYVDVLLTGAPFAMLDAARRIAGFRRRTSAST
jgi:peptidoglycan/xylan/chitin deacetylase (PgdA/CDA1 family)